ncbi:hypothetical protein Rs2_28710 [Raphanus sativus]|nr:hypothetical protein Rs2_28710 [Raphanus sativus]
MSLSGAMAFLAYIDSKFKEPSKEKLCTFPSEDGFSDIGAGGPVETDHSFSMSMYEQKMSSSVPSSSNSPNVSGRSISSGSSMSWIVILSVYAHTLSIAFVIDHTSRFRRYGGVPLLQTWKFIEDLPPITKEESNFGLTGTSGMKQVNAQIKGENRNRRRYRKLIGGGFIEMTTTTI